MAGRGPRVPRPASWVASMSQDLSANDDRHLELSSTMVSTGLMEVLVSSLPDCSSSWCGGRTKAAFYPGTFEDPAVLQDESEYLQDAQFPALPGVTAASYWGAAPLSFAERKHRASLLPDLQQALLNGPKTASNV